MNLLEGLNDNQKKIVNHNQGNLAVNATAGSGKTRVVVHRIAKLVDDGEDPEKILATTFTKKAATEMNERLEKLGCLVKQNPSDAGARVGTYHSLCLEIIRDGSPWRDFEIDAKDRMRYALKDILGFRGMNWKDADITEVSGFISMCKQWLVDVGDAFHFYANKDNQPFPFPTDSRFLRAYEAYELERNNRGVITFDDMLVLAVKYLESDQNALDKWSSKYEHIMVDEFQDSNFAQYRLMQLLVTEKTKSVVCVGDFWQCIFEWRGALPKFLIEFPKEWNAEEITLDINYRSLPEIVDLSTQVVKNNDQGLERQPIANRKVNGKSVYWNAASDFDDEARTVVDKIKELKNDGKSYSDFTVLYRVNAMSRAFEEAMIKEKIPHVVIGGVDFYRRKEIQDILAYLRLAVDSSNDKACKRAINTPFRYIGKVTLEELSERADDDKMSWYDWLAARSHLLNIQSRQQSSIDDFVVVIDELRQDIEADLEVPGTISKLVNRIKYIEWLTRSEGTDCAENDRTSNVREFIRTSARFSTVKEFLNFIDELAKIRKKRIDEKVEVVQLMSIHKSKALEFPVVFLAGASEKILPHARSNNLPEERRLFYVAMTRAMDLLYISSPCNTLINGRTVDLPVSRFVKEAGLIES